ncbi:MAG: hypothetical protein GY827_01450 [Cytophagales bacterium]|nr:hypothetical protein [Cytophagales bacterium]
MNLQQTIPAPQQQVYQSQGGDLQLTQEQIQNLFPQLQKPSQMQVSSNNTQ